MTTVEMNANTWVATPLPPASGPTGVAGVEHYGEPLAAVVRLDVALTRGQILAAVAEGFSYREDRDPDTLTVAEVRWMVEQAIETGGTLALAADADTIWDGFGTDDWGAELTERMLGLARAVDRAYPPAGSSPIVLDGTPMDPVARCTARNCGWTAHSDDVAFVSEAALRHAEVHGVVAR
ncbi:hypothetical protein [Streptomyces albus]|uniref:hypothetical protein n=1 Tax=Streptomyces sp. NRRL F-5917 TaxID=1463873 RepID=UPI0004C25E00|nr:hypothetical protein [Streptomyces sp. NRRL F-5917]